MRTRDQRHFLCLLWHETRDVGSILSWLLTIIGATVTGEVRDMMGEMIPQSRMAVWRLRMGKREKNTKRRATWQLCLIQRQIMDLHRMPHTERYISRHLKLILFNPKNTLPPILYIPLPCFITSTLYSRYIHLMFMLTFELPFIFTSTFIKHLISN